MTSPLTSIARAFTQHTTPSPSDQAAFTLPTGNPTQGTGGPSAATQVLAPLLSLAGNKQSQPLQPSLDGLVRDGLAETTNFDRFGPEFYNLAKDTFGNPQVSGYMDQFAQQLRDYNSLAAKNPSLPKADFFFGVHVVSLFSGGAAQNGLHYDKDKKTLTFDITLGDKFLKNNDVTGEPPARRGTTDLPADYEDMFRPPEIAMSNELVEQKGRLDIISKLAGKGEDIDTARMVAANVIGSQGFQTGTWAIDAVLPDYAYQTTGVVGKDAAERSRNAAAALEKADPKVLADLLNDGAQGIAASYGSNPYVETRDWVDNIANYDAIETKRGSFGHKGTVRTGGGHVETLVSGGGDGVQVTKDGAITLGNAREVSQEMLQNHLDTSLPPSMKGKIKVEMVETNGVVMPRFTAK